MFVGEECRSIRREGKCGVTALAYKERMIHKRKDPNPLLQSKKGNP